MALLGLGSLLAGVVLMVALHVVPPTDQIDPVRRTLSEYALGPNKWIFDLAVLAVAGGSALTFLELLRRKVIRPLSATVLLGAVWTVSLLVIVTFTKINRATGPTLGGYLHRYASLAAFLALPLAVIIMAGAVFPHAPAWRRSARALGLGSLLSFGTILLGVLNMIAGDGRPWWRFVPLGLVERVVTLSAVGAITVIILGMALQRVYPYQPRTVNPGDLCSNTAAATAAGRRNSTA